MSAKPYIATDMMSACHKKFWWVPGRNYRWEEASKNQLRIWTDHDASNILLTTSQNVCGRLIMKFKVDKRKSMLSG